MFFLNYIIWNRLYLLNMRNTLKKMAELTYAELTQDRESTCLPHTHKLTSLEKIDFGPKNPVIRVRNVPLPRTGNKTVNRQDSSPTEFLKTDHRQNWRQFTDTYEDSSPTLLYNDYLPVTDKY